MHLSNRADFADLNIFLSVIQRRSFKMAAIDLGLSPSAVSHALRRLEDRLGAKLLSRTSRAVAPTAVGLTLAASLGEGFDLIDEALKSLDAPGAARFGELRLNVFADAANLLIAPALAEFVRVCPDVRLTVVVEDRPIDIVKEGYDAGMRYGHHLPQDMVSVALTGPQQWVVAASPGYLREHGEPRTLGDLSRHTGLQLLLGDNSKYRWELGPKTEAQHVRMRGQLTINNTMTTIAAAKAGLGLAYLLQQRIRQELEEGSLRIVMQDYASPGEPFHIYYDRRRHSHPALRQLINIIRHNNGLSRLP